MGKTMEGIPKLRPFFPQVLAGAVARTCEDGCKYLWVQMQCTAMAVAVHCVRNGKTDAEIYTPIPDK